MRQSDGTLSSAAPRAERRGKREKGSERFVLTQKDGQARLQNGDRLSVTISTFYDYGNLLRYPDGAASFVPFYLGQTTEYVYGTTATSSSPDLNRNDLLTAVIEPDSTNSYDAGGTTGFSNGSGGYDRVQYAFDRQGETISMEDQDQTTHDYARDGVGRCPGPAIFYNQTEGCAFP